MSFTPNQRRTGNVAALYGYKNIYEDTVAAAAFTPGDGAIILTAKGEPVMSGIVQEVRDNPDGSSAIKVGDDWYYEGQYKFRDL